VWNYDDALPVNSYQNHNLSDRGLSKLLLINELDESLLLAASSTPLFSMFFLLHLSSTIALSNFHVADDGNVRVWKNFAQKGGQKLVTAFSSVQGHRAAGRSIVIDWQQQSGYLVCSIHPPPPRSSSMYFLHIACSNTGLALLCCPIVFIW
jgi:regulator-associated protein of mTOR